MPVHTSQDPEIYQTQILDQENENDWPKETQKKCPIKVTQTTTRVWLSLIHPGVHPHVLFFPPQISSSFYAYLSPLSLFKFKVYSKRTFFFWWLWENGVSRQVWGKDWKNKISPNSILDLQSSWNSQSPQALLFVRNKWKKVICKKRRPRFAFECGANQCSLAEIQCGTISRKAALAIAH